MKYLIGLLFMMVLVSGCFKPNYRETNIVYEIKQYRNGAGCVYVCKAAGSTSMDKFIQPAPCGLFNIGDTLRITRAK